MKSEDIISSIDNEMFYLSGLAGYYADAVKGKARVNVQASIGLLIVLVAKQYNTPVREFVEPIFSVIIEGE